MPPPRREETPGRARPFCRSPGRRPQQQHHALRPRELELGAHLGAVERARRDDGVALERDAVDVAREAESELRRHGRAVAHAVDGEAEQDVTRGRRPPIRRLEGRLVGVVLELVRRRPARSRSPPRPRRRPRRRAAPGSRAITATVTGPSSRPAVTSSRVTSRTCATEVLGHHEDAHASRSFTISRSGGRCRRRRRRVISAPSPAAGTNIRAYAVRERAVRPRCSDDRSPPAPPA